MTRGFAIHTRRPVSFIDPQATRWVATGLLYVAYGWRSRHFRKNLLPSAPDPSSYNPLQRATYLTVVFVLFPAMIWTGLAMSPAFTGAFPFLVDGLGGFQSARTLHFFVTFALVLFVIGHVIMVYRAGFRNRVQAMITGKEQL